MVKIFVLIIVFSGGGQTGKTSVVQEFGSLAQCQYVYKTLTEQAAKSDTVTYLTAGGCFDK